MIRLTIFIIALLLAIEALEPTAPWLVTLAVLSGMELFRLGRLGGRVRFRRRLRAWVGGPWSEECDW